MDSVLDLFYPVFPSIPNTRVMMSVHPYMDKYKVGDDCLSLSLIVLNVSGMIPDYLLFARCANVNVYIRK